MDRYKHLYDCLASSIDFRSMDTKSYHDALKNGDTKKAKYYLNSINNAEKSITELKAKLAVYDVKEVPGTRLSVLSVDYDRLISDLRDAKKHSEKLRDVIRQCQSAGHQESDVIAPELKASNAKIARLTALKGRFLKLICTKYGEYVYSYFSKHDESYWLPWPIVDYEDGLIKKYGWKYRDNKDFALSSVDYDKLVGELANKTYLLHQYIDSDLEDTLDTKYAEGRDEVEAFQYDEDAGEELMDALVKIRSLSASIGRLTQLKKDFLEYIYAKHGRFAYAYFASHDENYYDRHRFDDRRDYDYELVKHYGTSYADTAEDGDKSSYDPENFMTY